MKGYLTFTYGIKVIKNNFRIYRSSANQLILLNLFFMAAISSYK